MIPTEAKVSLCITCKGRLHHLRQTMPTNIEANRGFEGTEFVLLDYSSPDDLAGWVKTHLMHELESGRVVYYQAEGHPCYVPTHAKNVAHRLARSPIVCNLDADNYTGRGFACFLYDAFQSSADIFVCATGVRGASGRLGFLKRDFEKLGGYDEDLNQGWGFDDDDLKRRARAFGLKPLFIRSDTPFLKVLPHEDAERTRYTPAGIKAISRNAHAKLSAQRFEDGRYCANAGRKWGSARLLKNFTETIEI